LQVIAQFPEMHSSFALQPWPVAFLGWQMPLEDQIPRARAAIAIGVSAAVVAVGVGLGVGLSSGDP